MFSLPRQTRNRLLQVLDGVLFAVALGLAYLARVSFPFFDLAPLEPFSDYLWLSPFLALIGPVALASQGFYDSPRLPPPGFRLIALMRACALATLAMVVLLFMVRAQLARSVIILAGPFGGLLVGLRSLLGAWWTRSPFAQRRAGRRVLWVGASHETQAWHASLAAFERGLLESVGHLDPRQTQPEELAQILREQSVNMVALSLHDLSPADFQPVLAACSLEGVEVMVRPGLHPLSPYCLVIDQLGGEPILHYRAQSGPPAHLLAKQVLDSMLAAGLLLAAVPLALAIALAIRLSSPGPILFRQTRGGLNGRPFTLYKFRSMRFDAEQQQGTLLAQNEMKGPVFKLQNDPRITPVGRFLRRHSLDELPQLWNVLRGEMSLVGPRPLPTSEVSQFRHGAHRRRLSVKPGLTCLWQVNGRNEIADFDEWVRLDLAYIDQWSLWLDLKILLATIPVVLLGRGGR